MGERKYLRLCEKTRVVINLMVWFLERRERRDTEGRSRGCLFNITQTTFPLLLFIQTIRR